MNIGWMTCSLPWTAATYPLFAFASARSLIACTLSSGASGWVFGATRSWKILGELTILAWSGWARGTLMTSIRKRAVLGSFGAVTQPASSLEERTGAWPEIYM